MKAVIYTLFCIVLIYQPLLATHMHDSHVVNIAVPEINKVIVEDKPIRLSIPAAGTIAESDQSSVNVKLSLISNAIKSRVLTVTGDETLKALPPGAAVRVSIDLGKGITQSGKATPNTVNALSTTPSVLIRNLRMVMIPEATVTYTLVPPPDYKEAITLDNLNVTYSVTGI